MILHIFALRWKPEASDHQKKHALEAVHAFPEHIPGILALQAGTNLSQRGQGYETVGVLHFADQAGLQQYLVHPVHQAFVQQVEPWIEAIDLDLEI